MNTDQDHKTARSLKPLVPIAKQLRLASTISPVDNAPSAESVTDAG
jgi:hypothetical protein